MNALCFFFFLTSCAVFFVKGNKVLVSFPKNEMPSPGTATRVFGGIGAKENQFPFTIFVLIKGDQLSSCTASLVKDDKILLAAHCVPQNIIPSNVISVAGKPDLTEYIATRMRTPFSQGIDEASYGIQERFANQIFRSDGFTDPRTLNHDMAILSVNRPFVLANNVQVIPIATDKLVERTRCTILGWGLKEGNELSSILLYSPSAYVVPLDSCKHKKSGSFLCLEKSRSGICQGDSGSPLVCNDKVYGVASHILAMVQNAACGDDIEEVYAEVYSERQWIDDKLGYTSGVVKEPEGTNNKGGTGGAAHTTGVIVLVHFAMLIMLL